MVVWEAKRSIKFKYPWKLISWWKDINRTVWWQAQELYVKPSEVSKPLYNVLAFTYRTLRSLMVNDAFKPPVKVSYRKEDEFEEVRIETREETKYYLPPDAGELRLAVDFEEHRKLAGYIRGSKEHGREEVLKTSLQELMENVEETTVDYVAEKQVEASRKKMHLKQLSQNAAYWILEGERPLTALTIQNPYARWVSSEQDMELLKQKLAEERDWLANMFKNLYDIGMDENRITRVNQETYGSAIAALKSYPSMPVSMKIFRISDINANMDGYTVVVFGKVGSQVGLAVIAGSESYIVFTVNDGTGEIEVWLPATTKIGTVHAYVDRNILVSGIVRANPYLHIEAPTEDNIALL